MSVKTDVVNLRVNVGNDKAQNNLNELRKTAADLKFEMDGLNKKSAEYAAKKKQLADVNSQMAALKQTIGLTALSQKELNKELRTLTAMRNSVVPFSDEYKRLDASIKQVKNRLYEVNNGVQGFSATFSKVKDEVKQFGMLAAGYLGFQFLTSSFTNLIQGAGKLSDSLADLQRVTGLSREETRQFNEELKRLDTRTSTQQLREIAIVAGKLGVAKDDLLGFTQAVDMLVVALGDELGNADQITSTLGKILQVFDGEINGDNITRLGNAIVQLANTGSATGAFVADFNQRLSGIAKSAGIGLGALSGLGAGLEEMGGRVESSATAVQKIIISISSNLPAAAKIAGMELKEFNELFSKEPQEALLRYAAGLVRNKQSFAEITQSFAAAGEDGARVIETLSKLGQNTEFLRKRMQLGTEALQQNGAILDAFNLKNETLGATIDKLVKEFNKLIASDGVQNFLKSLVNGAFSAINGLRALGEWISKNTTTLYLWTAALIINTGAWTKAIAFFAPAVNWIKSLTVATSASTIAQRAAAIATTAWGLVVAIFTGNMAKLRQEFALLKVLMGTNPLGLFLIAVGAAILAVRALGSATQKVSVEMERIQRDQKLVTDVMKDANGRIAEQLSKINLLTTTINSNVTSLDEKKRALKELIALDPEFLKGISLSNDGHLQGTRILDAYIRKLNEAAMAEALKAKRTELFKNVLDATAEIEQNQLSADGQAAQLNFREQSQRFLRGQATTQGPASLAEARDAARRLGQGQSRVAAPVLTLSADNKVRQAAQNAANARKIEAERQIAVLDNLQRKYTQTANVINATNETVTAGIITPGGTAAEQKKQDALIRQAREFYASLAKLKEVADSKELSEEEQEIVRTKQRYADLLKQAVDFFQQKALSRQQFSEAEATIAEALEKEIAAIRRKYNEKEFIARTEQEYRDSLEARRNYSEELKRLAAFDYSQGKISKEQYQAEIIQIERDEKADLIIISQSIMAELRKQFDFGPVAEVPQQIPMLVQQYYDFKCLGKKGKSVITYRAQVEAFVRWYRTSGGHHYDLETMGNAFLAYLSREGRSNTTVNNYRSNLGSIFRLIVKAKKLAINPFEMTAKQRENRKTNEWFRAEQVDELKKVFTLTDPVLWLACRLQFYCFIRPCEEMRNITIGDLQLSDRRIRIRAEVSKSGGHDEYVELPDSLLQDLQPYKQYPSHFYLFGKSGYPCPKKIGRDSLSRRHNAYLRSAGYPKGFTFYSWKNTGAVHMLRAGISILHISRLMRHRSLDHTTEYFKSLGFRDVQDDIQKLMPLL